MSRRLILFAKDPCAGRVKTRLAAATGEAWAVALYEAFLEDLSETLLSEREWESVLAHAEPRLGARLAERFARGWAFTPQGEGGLGDRLDRVFSESRLLGVERTIVVGSDAPTLSAVEVRSAFEALNESDVVLAPSPDGGYALIGLTASVDPSGLFAEVRWSTDQALADTRRAIEARGLRTGLLGEIPDVDVAADLAPLRARLEAEPARARATLRALREPRATRERGADEGTK